MAAILTLLASMLMCCSGKVLAQVVGSKQLQPATVPDSAKLEENAVRYERFITSPPAGTNRFNLIHARTQLATAYFLLHRYSDSLAALRPLQSEDQSKIPPQAWSIKGLDELELNESAKAVRSLRRALAENPSSATTRLALGDALARSNQMNAAAVEYKEQTRLTPSLPDAWYKLGLAHSQISVELSHAQVKLEDQAIQQQLIGEELIAKGDNLNAARILFRVVRRSPAQPEAHADLGTALLALGYSKAAQDHFRQELINNPNSPSAQLGLAETAALSGDWNEVNKSIENLSRSQSLELTLLLQVPPAGLVINAWNGKRIAPPQWFVTSNVGKLWQTWLSGAETISRITPKNAGPLAQCSGDELRASAVPGIWLTQNCYEKLETRLRAAKQLSSAPKIKLAEAEYRLGHYDFALHSATLLHASDPHNAWGTYWLSKTHDALAEECFLKVGTLNPDSARVHQMLAEQYTRLSDYTKARSEYEAALHLTPDSPELHLGLGTVLARTGNWGEGETELKKTLELAPESDFAHYQLGHVYVQQNMWQPAIEQLRQVPSSSTELLSARLDLSQAEAETEQTSAAIQDLLSVARLDHDGEVYFRLAALYRKIGDDAHAHEALAKFKQMRATSLEADKDELSALENEQQPSHASSP